MTEVLALIARAYDPLANQVSSGIPVPGGETAAGDEVDGLTTLGEVTAVYASDLGYTSKPADTPANTHFPPALTAPFNFQAFALDAARNQGEAEFGFGVIELANGDGAFDAALAFAWDGRALELWKGEQGAAFSTFTKVFDGTVEALEDDTTAIRLRLRDRRVIFDRPLQIATYSGTGGVNGTADLAGVYRPVCFGACPNVAPVLIDPANLVYQFHFRQANAVSAVRDKGAALALDTTVGTAGDAPTYADLVAAAVASGKYATCLAQGLIRLGASPAGTVTANVEGDADGGYVNTTGTIIRRIVTEFLLDDSFADPAGLDTAAFTAFEAAQSAVVGFPAGTAPVRAADAIAALARAAGAYGFVKLNGLYSLAQLVTPAGAAALSLTAATVELEDPPPSRVLVVPTWRRRIGYQHLGVAQSPDDLAAAVTDADRAFYGTLQRFAVAEANAVRTRHRLAPELTIDGYFAAQADAATEVSRQQTLAATEPHLYRLRPKDVGLFDFDFGDVVEVSGITRLGLSDPQKLLVVGLIADAEEGRLELILWG